MNLEGGGRGAIGEFFLLESDMNRALVVRTPGVPAR
jgi:hypothetical protein